MKPNLPPFMGELKERDPEFFEAVAKVMETASAPGALDPKTKTLISLALDTYIGSERGVMALAQRARSLGATESEINEALRLAISVALSKPVITSNSARPARE